MVVFEIGAAVGLGRVEKQAKEVVRQVVVGLHIFKMGRQLHGHTNMILIGVEDP
jgi:hypothetical protein